MDGFDYSMQAIPTSYGGTVFRSRLEAHWAAFFDLLSWPYQYEPFDLHGWTPDFLLDGAQKVLVEVKPYITPEVRRNVMRAHHKSFVELSGDPMLYEILLLTTGPTKDGYGQITLGELCEYYNPDFMSIPDDDKYWDDVFGEAVMGVWYGSESQAKNPKQIEGFCSGTGWFRDRITGCYDGGSHGSGESSGITIWREAGNLVRWWKDRDVKPKPAVERLEDLSLPKAEWLRLQDALVRKFFVAASKHPEFGNLDIKTIANGFAEEDEK